MDNDLISQINELREEIAKLKRDYSEHQHDDFDGTKTLTKTIELKDSEHARIGLLEQATLPIRFIGTTAEQLQYSFSLSSDRKEGIINKYEGLQLSFVHLPNSTAKQSFINAFRSPVVSPNEGQTIDTTAGGNTVTISGFGFTTNELAGALINILDSSGALVECQTITSNTATVITITGTWKASTTGGTFGIYVPVFFGSADTIWQRFYTQEGTGGGIRFGVGVTAGALNQNGLLYMDATGDLYWRNKSGTSTKLN